MLSKLEISAAETFAELLGAKQKLVDVRSEKEFGKGHFSGTSNVPILNDQHRHMVGFTYKKRGQEAAVMTGHELVGPVKDQLVQRWMQELEGSQTLKLVMCWRGGMRSTIACQWLREAGLEVVQVSGGYKAVRRLVLQQLEAMPRFTVLAGYTGSRKTNLLKHRRRCLDLEALAEHRGSAFGRIYGVQQPSQATFENRLGLALARLDDRISKSVLVEDESVNLGRCFFPKPLGAALVAGELVWLEVALPQRVANIYEDYVLEPLATGIARLDLLQHYSLAVHRIRDALGGAVADQISRSLADAFAHDEELERHSKWIQPLVETYYDKRYRHGCERQSRQEIFRGDVLAVKEYLESEGF